MLCDVITVVCSLWVGLGFTKFLYTEADVIVITVVFGLALILQSSYIHTNTVANVIENVM